MTEVVDRPLGAAHGPAPGPRCHDCRFRDHSPLFFEHTGALGVERAGPTAGLSEREDPDLSAALDLDALVIYANAVFDGTATWLERIDTMALDSIPDTGRRLTDSAKLSVDEVGWLHRMWDDKPVWWLIQWPVVGHGHAHVGEAISVRNRMGLSPF